ncbi:MAG TPA: hypothetical protein VFW25_12685 [Silvibacterium sp.]|nr:hypothetical protein [Silvibacterium sp.]
MMMANAEPIRIAVTAHPRKAGLIVKILPCKSCLQSRIALRLIAWASVAVGVAAVGLYVGHELRVHYKFKRRTPSDFYSHAGDQSTAEFDLGAAEYGVGI